ncbi:MAG TPA: SpoIIE family protein phosphatase, partial [Gemmatimonadales bacterium]|nr:SpoIIE family protein phosphatase [Gemmatimonadales bacterium]
LATNLVRHAGGGEMLARPLARKGEAGVEVVTLDRGPGIARVDQALRDGFSTAGTNGVGLGAVSRLASRCDLYSMPGTGTAVVARMHFAGPPDTGRAVVGGVSVAKPGERACGDAWDWATDGERWTIFVADGLGHGTDASIAAAEAVRVYREQDGAPARDVIGLAHGALRHTRGAAVAMAEVRPGRQELTFAGVGNIGATIVSGGASRSLVSIPGIVGHECRKIQEFSYPWASQAVVVLFSDGLQTRWTLDRYPALTSRDPTLVAALLYRDYSRGRDDVTVVAGREDSPA